MNTAHISYSSGATDIDLNDDSSLVSDSINSFA